MDRIDKKTFVKMSGVECYGVRALQRMIRANVPNMKPRVLR